ncbi:MAG: hypothetical protein QM811_06040 [Pirellulales bacterium]
MKGTRLAPIVVVHANHAQEIDADVGAAFRRLVDAGIPTLNQTVLLRGVNDTADVLAALSERLLDYGVLPYYLHQLDRVQGAAHFEVDEAVGLCAHRRVAFTPAGLRGAALCPRDRRRGE